MLTGNSYDYLDMNGGGSTNRPDLVDEPHQIANHLVAVGLFQDFVPGGWIKRCR